MVLIDFVLMTQRFFGFDYRISVKEALGKCTLGKPNSR
jgi:hypothetical protein